MSDAIETSTPKILRPDKIIEALESFTINPYRDAHPLLYVIIKDESDDGNASYLKMLKKKSEKYGSRLCVIKAPTMVEAIGSLASIKQDPNAYGVMILGSYGPSEDAIIHNMIPSRLDIDCNSANAYGMFVKSTSQVGYRDAPCTAVACYKFLEYEDFPLSGARVGIVGRSFRVGRPLAGILTSKNATVTLYNSHSDLSMLKSEHVVVTAIGKPRFFTADMFVPGQWVIDVGINVDDDGKICGDVDFDNVCKTLGKHGAITPVPKGVGPLTNVIVFSKLFMNYAQAIGASPYEV